MNESRRAATDAPDGTKFTVTTDEELSPIGGEIVSIHPNNGK